MPVVRVITAYENELVEIQWTLRDSTKYYERHRIPPRIVVRARQQVQALSGATEVEPAVPEVREEGQASE